MYGYTTSQKIEIVVIIASLVLYFCGLNSFQQNVWSFVFATAVIMLIVDMLFMKDSTFDYEPHYQNWQRKQEADV